MVSAAGDQTLNTGACERHSYSNHNHRVCKVFFCAVWHTHSFPGFISVWTSLGWEGVILHRRFSLESSRKGHGMLFPLMGSMCTIPLFGRGVPSASGWTSRLFPASCSQMAAESNIFFGTFLFLWYWDLNSGPSPWATPPVLFLWKAFQDRVLWTIYLGWLWSSWSLPPE
jgi:hypothetical protein